MVVNDDTDISLIFRVSERLCALPIANVIETMRPLPVEPWSGASGRVAGLSIIRGVPVPVIDLSRLLGEEHSSAARFVTLAIDGRVVALAVGDVLGVRPIPARLLQPVPPLLQEVDALAAIGALDAELLVVLQSARLIPDDLWAASAADEPPA